MINENNCILPVIAGFTVLIAPIWNEPVGITGDFPVANRLIAAASVTPVALSGKHFASAICL